MNELLNNYTPYGEFLRESYFVQAFDIIPSRLWLELPMDTEKTNMDRILEKLREANIELEPVFKKWKISATKAADATDDFPTQYYYKSNAQKVSIWVSLEYEKLLMEFLYNHHDDELEKWVVGFCRSIRDEFGKDKSPTFKVLSKGAGQFYTEDININHFEVDVPKLYNDDFLPIHDIIEDALAVDSSGLILLHGPPGTGKTSYIKSLLSTHGKRNFIYIPNDLVNELLQPDFISFLLTSRNSILVIEDAEKVITSREQNPGNSVVSTILQLTDGLFSDFLNIKVICTFNTSIDKIDKALLRKGRMIAFYEFKALEKEKTNALLQSLDVQLADKAMTLAEIFNADKREFEESPKTSIGFI